MIILQGMLAILLFMVDFFKKTKSNNELCVWKFCIQYFYILILFLLRTVVNYTYR